MMSPKAMAIALLAAPLFAVHAAAAQGTQQAPPKSPKPNWQNLDLQQDGNFGISTERAYKLLANKKKATQILVAVIDGGIDTGHVDLKAVLWHNKKEKPGNHADDDNNGYADDMMGWDFIGGPKGDVEFDNLELVRQIKKMRPKYGVLADSDSTRLSAAERDSLFMYKNMMNDYNQQLGEARQTLASIEQLDRILTGMVANMKKKSPTIKDFEKYQPQAPGEAQVASILIGAMREGMTYETFKNDQIEDGKKHFKDEIDYNLNFDYDPRAIVGDDTTNDTQRGYGNNDVKGPDADHGTHVAGIIGAVRTNSIGVKGVADHVTIMAVRAIPTGDERDKDVANAIRYAVDNGARVINMSFGKSYSNNKKVVDDAVKYAMSKNVLLVHAAGNDGKNLDGAANFPNRTYADSSGTAENWIEVGASGWTNDENLVPSFSNYGKTSVDVFAPGARIRSTVPGSKYNEHDGTSMAAPVVTGLAALILSRYPALTAAQVKDIIMKSVVKVDHPVTVRSGNSPQSVPFSDLCVSGGVVNAYNALKLAETYK